MSLTICMTWTMSLTICMTLCLSVNCSFYKWNGRMWFAGLNFSVSVPKKNLFNTIYYRMTLTLSMIICMIWTMSLAICITSPLSFFLQKKSYQEAPYVTAAKVKNSIALEKFRRKQRSLLHNQGYQCFPTTVLQYSLYDLDLHSV